MKASSSRRLWRPEISIVVPSNHPDIFAQGISSQTKTVALIEPMTDTVWMDHIVAEKRGLRGFTPQTLHLGKGSVRHKDGKSYFTRRAKVESCAREVAQVSISHDGDYASAVAILADLAPPQLFKQEIIDKGEGLAIHEPIWSDRDWMTPFVSSTSKRNGKLAFV